MHGRAINGSIWMSGCFFLGTKSMMFGGVEKCWKNISLIIIIIIIIIIHLHAVSASYDMIEGHYENLI